jgi:hypothetical protein
MYKLIFSSKLKFSYNNFIQDRAVSVKENSGDMLHIFFLFEESGGAWRLWIARGSCRTTPMTIMMRWMPRLLVQVCQHAGQPMLPA